VLILRDILSFSAAETAEVLADTPAAVNSALQRARDTVRRRRASTDTSQPGSRNTFSDVVFLQVYMDASERGDIDAIVNLLREDVHMTLFPDGLTWDGRDDVACEFFKLNDRAADVRMVAVAANRQPAVAVYRRQPDDTEYRAWSIVLLGVVDGKLA